MTKSELIEAIAARGDLTKARAELIVNCVFDSMTDALRRGDGIEIRGFGSFSVRPYKPYAGRNPRTGNPVPVSAKKLPFFKVGKELRELVDKSRALNAQIIDDDLSLDDDLGELTLSQNVTVSEPSSRSEAGLELDEQAVISSNIEPSK